TINDITKQKEAEADLRRKEKELRDFIENSNVALHWVGPDGNIIWANRAELNLLGYTEEEYLGHAISEFHADQHILDDIIRRLNTKETLYNYEARLKASDGSIKHVLISSNVLWDEEGHFVHTRSFTRDITERKRAEEALRESEERHRAILEQVSEAIFLIDPHTKRFVTANPAFQRLVGYTADEILDMQIYDVLPYERERIDRAVLRALNEGDYRVSDRLYRRKDGSLVHVEVGITPVFYAGKKVLCEIVRDITARKQAEEERNKLLRSEQAARREAEEALRVRDELLAVVSHDLKNPLAAIKGNAQLLRQRIEKSDMPDVERFTTVLARVDTAQAKMNMLINELMDFGRLQAGLPLTLQRRPTDLLTLIRQVVAEQQETTERHNIQVVVNVPDLMGRWDAERLERAVTNLLSNAIKYSSDGGDITVTVALEPMPDSQSKGEEKANGWASIVVKDQGLGISSEDLPHIFEWFRRASSVAGRISGAGIGLASSLHAVRQHGGTIEVESEPGSGSTFTIRLPIDV
ncbi:MAG: PAS domain-containing sensor histidine kinase, partial [Chloroflexia bacterium]